MKEFQEQKFLRKKFRMVKVTENLKSKKRGKSPMDSIV
jgi:hypothetical protein